MKDIKKPEFMREGVTGKGYHLAIELLIAAAVFLVGSILEGVIQVPATMVYMLTNREYIHMLQTGALDFELILHLIMDMPAWMFAAMLVSEIGLIAAVLLYCRFLEKRKLRTLGITGKGMVFSYAKGVALGLGTFGAVYGICVLTGSIRFIASPEERISTGMFLLFLVGYMIQGMAEELLCRGYLFVSLTRRNSMVVSVVVSSVFFAALHGMNAGLSIMALINLFLFGVMEALIFIRTENIWVAGAFHSIWNFVQGNIFGVQVSGLKVMPSVFGSEFVSEHRFINGGAFGIEGGLSVTLVLAVIIGILLMNMRERGDFIEVDPVVKPQEALPVNQQTIENNRLNNQLNNQMPFFGNSQGNQDNPVNQSTMGGMGENPHSGGSGMETGQQPGGSAPVGQPTQTGFDSSYFKD